MFKHLLIATDGSELAQKAVEQGLEFAKAVGAKATAVTVTEPWIAVAPGEMAIAFPIEDYDRGVAENAAATLATVRASSKRIGMECATLHVKDQFPAEGILETAEARGCDLIVMASHGRRGLKRLLLGSQANTVVTRSSVPVLIYR